MKFINQFLSSKTRFSIGVCLCAFLGAATITLFAQQYSPSTLVVNTTGHGEQLGTKPTQGLSFWGATPVVQGTGTHSGGLVADLQNYGLLAAGDVPNLGTVGAITASSLTLANGSSPFTTVVFGTGTMVNGSGTVATPEAVTGANIQVTPTGTTGAGYVGIGTINSGTNFTVKSTGTGDDRTFDWLLIHD